MNFNFIQKRNIFFMLSALVIAIGLIYGFATGLNLGLDFTGGTMLQIDFGKIVPVENIRKITDTFDTKASIIHAGINKEEIIIKSTLDLNNQERTEVFAKFKDEYSLQNEALIQSQIFGPSIGSEILLKAIISLILATIGILVYTSFRFELKFGIAAIIALVHDALVIFAVYAIFKVPLDSTFVAAILTIVGYSINDTIVIFDRIRENLKLMKKDTYENIANISIKQTLPRTFNTTLTTLIAIVALYVFGVEAIKNFAFPLIIGILSGTYSSIFIASPLWHLLKTRYKDKDNVNINRA